MVDDTSLKLAYNCEDDAASTTVTDSHASNNGTAQANTSTISTTGKHNKGFDINETTRIDSYTQADSAFSISLWFFWDGSGNPRGFVGNEDSGTTTGGFWVLSRSTDAKLHLQSYDGSTEHISATWTDSTTVGDSAWHHFVLTFDGSQTWAMWIDGTKMNLADSTGVYSAPSQVVSFGGSAAYSDFPGKMDEILWYDRVLSDQDIADLYNDGDGTFFPFRTDITVTPSALTITTSQPNDDLIILAAPVTLSNDVSIAIPIVVRKSVPDSEVGTGTKGTRFVQTSWPFTQGNTARTTSQQGRTMNLIAEQGGTILERNTAGLD
tara:strand:- start:80 stop:1045 length:966 start_codon:yes stop_codon:yes gene_type:complete